MKEIIDALEEYLSENAFEDDDPAYGLGYRHLTISDVKKILAALQTMPENTQETS